MIKKIVVIGPESTGKSFLCGQLAEHFNTTWVKEYAREYLLMHGKDYSINDLYEIAGGQIKEEEKGVAMALNANPDQQCIFIDTDLYVIKVWSEFVFHQCDNRILNQIAAREYDLYLLCNTDLPWVKDSLREYPDLETREKLFHYYKEAMINQNVPWLEIKGDYENRLSMAIDAINELK